MGIASHVCSASNWQPCRIAMQAATVKALLIARNIAALQAVIARSGAAAPLGKRLESAAPPGKRSEWVSCNMKVIKVMKGIKRGVDDIGSTLVIGSNT